MHTICITLNDKKNLTEYKMLLESNSLGSLSGNLFLLLLYSCSASEKVTG